MPFKDHCGQTKAERSCLWADESGFLSCYTLLVLGWLMGCVLGDRKGTRDGWANKPGYLGIPIPPRILLIYGKSSRCGFHWFE